MQVEWLHQLKEEDTASTSLLRNAKMEAEGSGYARLEERSTTLGMPLSLDSPLKRYPRIPKGSWNWHRGSDLDPLIISAHIRVLATVQGTLQGEVYISRFSLVSRSQTASSLHFFTE